MTRTNKTLAILAMSVGLAVPAISRAEDRVPTPPDSRTGVPGSVTNTPGGDNSNNRAQGGTAAADNQQATDRNAKLDHADKEFILKATEGGLAEVQLGQIAQQQGSSQAVKDFGKQMVTDHTQANQQLATIAQQKGVTVPTELKGEEKEHVEKLSKLQGEEFDKAYTKHMILDHNKDIKEFEKEAKKAKDANLQAFAQKTLPILEQHRQMIGQVAQGSGDKDLARLASEKQPPEVKDDAKNSSNTNSSKGELK